jgi:hypothetical protein
MDASSFAKGGNHSVFVNGAKHRISTVQRHREINDFTARKIGAGQAGHSLMIPVCTWQVNAPNQAGGDGPGFAGRSPAAKLDAMTNKATDTWLSWKHRRSQFTKPIPFDKKVSLFYERLYGWQLHIADLCANKSTDELRDHSGFAVLHICLSYFETIGKYQAGFCHDSESRLHFDLGLKAVFEHTRRMPQKRFEDFSERLYKAARNGLYHASQTGPGVLLRVQPSAVRFDSGRGLVTIDPHRLPVRLKKHLDEYRSRLESRRKKKLCKDFEARFAHDNPKLV